MSCKEAEERFFFLQKHHSHSLNLGMLWELVVKGLTVPAAIPPSVLSSEIHPKGGRVTTSPGDRAPGQNSPVSKMET